MRNAVCYESDSEQLDQVEETGDILILSAKVEGSSIGQPRAPCSNATLVATVTTPMTSSDMNICATPNYSL